MNGNKKYHGYILRKSGPIIPVLLLVWLVSCERIDQWIVLKENKREGILRGKISIGPLCPVENDPPDSSCLPTADTYRAWATALFTTNGKTKVASLFPDLSGNFIIAIPSGKYVINFDPPRSLGIGGSNLPMPADIQADDTLYVSIHIDTGIR